ncbi:MAG: SCO family protein [Candidatus Eremiobacteraeota bacterium]|nr:SCO family protein [Candidatus Eremiobacteraeota bacterium]
MLRLLITVAVLCWVGAGALPVPAIAAALDAQPLHGVVLTVLAQQHEAIVRHDRYGSIPSMTTVFHLPARAGIPSLHVGDRIEANVRETPAGLQLDAIRITAQAPPTAPPLLRNVQLLRVGETLPNTRFVDQQGKPFTFSDFVGKDVVLAFIYTRCRDARECPLISSNFHTLQQHIGTRPYHLVEITLDPAYDTPAVLEKYARLFDANPGLWTLGTGKPSEVLDFLARFGIEPFDDPRVGLIHTERTTLLDRRGRIVDFIDEAGWSVDGILARLAGIESAPENPLARLDYELSKAAVAVCGNAVAGFSGLADLAVVLLIMGGAVWLMLRFGRRIFREQI